MTVNELKTSAKKGGIAQKIANSDRMCFWHKEDNMEVCVSFWTVKNYCYYWVTGFLSALCTYNNPIQACHTSESVITTTEMMT